ncbi:hypothetical protein VF21_06659 [Pseudogymnoascus sp. 05NY08]|nr:hypothetical protein VF21_06659 [Pseudogymnoascus sp. 05NY08]
MLRRRLAGSLIRLNYGARPKVHLWLDASVNSLAAGLKFIATFRLATFTINDTCVAVSSTHIIMAAEQRKLLEQLMGASSSTRSAQLSITDPKLCRSYLVGTCPHDLFTNTKQDLGPCPKVHSEPLKEEYLAAPSKYSFEFDYLRDLQKYIDDCNRRIDTAQRRLEKTPDEIRQTNALLKQISDLAASIQTGLLEIEVLGSSGLVSRALDEHVRIRAALLTKSEHEAKLKALSDTSGPSGHQKLQVCDVCGAYLSRLDNDRRLADHFYGKMHLGYAQMRREAEKLQKELKGRQPPPRAEDDRDKGYGGGYDDGGWGGRGGGFGGRGGGRGGGFRGGRGRGGFGRGGW